MVTTLYLIRHGETEGSAARRYYGSTDVPLSERGREQVRMTAAFIREIMGRKNGEGEGAILSPVYCSSLSRAVKSAQVLAGSLGVGTIAVPGLRERAFGVWEGMTFGEIRRNYPEELTAWEAGPVTYRPRGGESTAEVKKRAVKALEEILAGHRGETVPVVAHGGVNRILLCHFLGVPLKNIFRIEQDFAAVNVVEFWDDYPVVKALNVTLSFSGGVHG
ncbi:MAG: histidine phosphatase family protein [Nitrospirae bacterium]|nr:histidine phosphatase family protein [Nitrospirota bacterium]